MTNLQLAEAQQKALEFLTQTADDRERLEMRGVARGLAVAIEDPTNAVTHVEQCHNDWENERAAERERRGEACGGRAVRRGERTV